ncbi:MAG TPA: hypothetical protein VGJ13_04860 [Pseudonocardiaceae bacterium]
MSHGHTLILAGVAIAALWLFYQWHVRRYPEILKCSKCGGSGKIESRNLFGTKVRGTCPKCGGAAWGDRGGDSGGWG